MKERGVRTRGQPRPRVRDSQADAALTIDAQQFVFVQRELLGARERIRAGGGGLDCPTTATHEVSNPGFRPMKGSPFSANPQALGNPMLRTLTLLCLVFAFAADALAAEKIKVMLLSGRSNKYHSWQGTGDAINQHLGAAGIFSVETVLAPPAGQSLDGFAPNWGAYDVVVLNYDGEEWPETTKAAFVDYVRGGGGLVLVHGANNSFAYWPEFLEMTGLGGWGGSGFYDPPLAPQDPSRKRSRDETWGPRVHWVGCQAVHDAEAKGGAGHPARHDFLITTRDLSHPIMQGLPEMWLQASDEVYSNLRGPAKNLQVLATGFADPKLKGASPYNEPILFTVSYGRGRVFQTTLGHVGAKQNSSEPSVQSVGFITTLQRGVEWAATGKVTIPVPDDFPTAYNSSIRPAPALK